MLTLSLATTPTDQIIRAAVQILQTGGLIIYPTETVYGVGVVATNQKAVEKLLRYKKRREGKPLSIAVADQKMAEKYVNLNDQARALYRQFLPGPLTIISADRGLVAPGVASEFQTLGIRWPAYRLITDLVAQLGQPMTATSANSSGKKQPYTIQDVWQHLSSSQQQLVDLVIDAGQLPQRSPSTVIDTTLSTPLTVRAGDQLAYPIANSWQVTTHSAQETQQLAGKLILKYWSTLKDQGLVIGLDGPLGAGKTVFAGGVAKFLQLSQTLTSPTYTYLRSYLFNRHQVTGQLHHLDVWRIDRATELAELKIDSLRQPGQLVLIEWWSQIAQFLPTWQPLIVNIALPTEKNPPLDLTAEGKTPAKADQLANFQSTANLITNQRLITVQEPA